MPGTAIEEVARSRAQQASRSANGCVEYFTRPTLRQQCGGINMENGTSKARSLPPDARRLSLDAP
jgi:hypothetical protein